MISLADLRARDVSPVWQEAVAVVQELIHTVRATTGSAELLPDLEHIALIPNGDVVAIPGSPTPDQPVRHVAILLKLLLDGVAAPPELTVFIERNTASPPQHDTVAEFSRGLAFFERPGRRSDVERLVSRAMAVDVQRRADRELELLKARAAEVARNDELPGAPTQRIRSPRRPAVVVSALLVIAVLGGAAFYLSMGSADVDEPTPGDMAAGEGRVSDNDPGGTNEAESPAAEPAPVVEVPPPSSTDTSGASSALVDATRSVSEVVGFAVRAVTGRRETVVRPVADPPSPQQQSGAPSPRASSARSRARASATPSVAPSGDTPLPVPATPVTGAAPAEAALPVRAGTADVAPAIAVAPAPTLVYTAADHAVLPPVLVRPVLPKEPPPNVPPDKIGTIEVVVDEQGDVVSVKLISPANRFHERMLVSAAKMWKFRPAYKDGQPVRYRTRVRLTI